MVVRGNGGHNTRKDIFTCPHNRIVAVTILENDIEVEVFIGAILHNRLIIIHRHGNARINCNCHYGRLAVLVVQAHAV